MKRQKKNHWNTGKILACVLLCAAILGGRCVPVEASQGNGISYSVKAILPENQREGTQGYFDLMMSPGTEQTLEVEVKNYSEESKTIHVEVATATTNSGGVVDYGVRENVEKDDTLAHRMEDLVTTEESIEIAAGEAHTLQVQVVMPADAFAGVLAGGINFKEEGTQTEEVDPDAGVAIQNEYTYVIALLLRTSDNPVTPELQLNDVKATQQNWKNVISANLQNIEAEYTNEMKVDAKVRKKGNDEVLYEVSQEQMQMAPNSNFNYLIPLNGERFEAGTYVLTMEVESLEGSWSFEKEFEITAEEAREFNDKDVTIEKSNLWIFVTIGGVILAVIFFIFLIVWYRKKNKKRNLRLKGIIEEIISRIRGSA